jgi:hypothetical protein
MEVGLSRLADVSGDLDCGCPGAAEETISGPVIAGGGFGVDTGMLAGGVGVFAWSVPEVVPGDPDNKAARAANWPARHPFLVWTADSQ